MWSLLTLCGQVACTCLLGLLFLRINLGVGLTSAPVNKPSKHSPRFERSMGSAVGKQTVCLSEALLKEAHLPSDRRLPPISVTWDSSSTGSSDSPVSAGPVTPAKLHFESSQHLPSKSEISPQNIAFTCTKGNKSKTLQKFVNDRALINALFGASLPDSPSLRYKQKCLTRSYLTYHGRTAEQAKDSVQHMSAQQMYDACADFHFHLATPQDTTQISDDFWEAEFDIQNSQAWFDGYGNVAK